MALDINNSSNMRVPPTPEIKLNKAALDLYLGQILRATVITAGQGAEDEVLLNINGQSVSAKTTQQFAPGDQFEVKVTANQAETVLEIQQKPLSPAVLQKYALQSALMQVLPKQAPPTNLLDNLNQLEQSGKLPPAINQQIRALLATITPLAQLPQQLMQAINKSGVFLESALLNWQQGMATEALKTDFKGQYLKLLDSLPPDIKTSLGFTTNQTANLPIKQDSLPLPGAVVQPLHKGPVLDLAGLSPDNIKNVLHEQVTQVLARITANQINHLSQENNHNAFVMMLDVPIKVANNIDVIPLKIEELPQKSEEGEEEASNWSISFAASLSDLGDVQATISLNDTNIDIRINSEKVETKALLQNHEGEVGELMSQLGLKLRHFNLRHGLEDNHIETSNFRLLDIQV